jgi:predicted molibdopterin-dependent oxidoreductase YjgC
LVYERGTEAALLDRLLAELGENAPRAARSEPSQATGIAAEKIRELAQALKKAESVIILCGKEIARHPQNAELLNKLQNLMPLTGHHGKAGCGVNLLWMDCNSQGALDCGVLPDRLPAYADVADESSRGKVERVWNAGIPHKPGLDFNLMLEAAHQGKIKAMYIVGADPVSEYPNGEYVKDALKKLEFLVVQDILLTETAKLARVVLPGVSFAEKNGTFTNVERRIQRLKRAFDPLGDSKVDCYIICMLAQAMGHDFDYASPAEIFTELIKVSPIHEGMGWEDLGETGKRWKRV